MRIRTPRSLSPPIALAWVIPVALAVAGCLDETEPEHVAETTQAVGNIDDLVNVDQYALGCYAELEVKPADMEPIKGFDCKAGERLTTTWTHKGTPYPLKAEDTTATWPDGSQRVAGTQPPMCDTPMWLSGECHGAQAYVTKLPTKNKNVDAVLLCRHKNVWSNDDDNFDDVAIIMHNKKNGKTCWFQALDPKLSRVVPPPTTAAANNYFISPQRTATIECYKCHDNGPWMNSPWIFQAGEVPKDRHRLYSSPGAAFKAWPEMKAVAIGTRGLPVGKESCTSCHSISTVASGPRTHDKWMDRVIGRKHNDATSPHGQTWELAGWMPADDWPGNHGYKTMKDFDKAYDHTPERADTRPSHIAELKACMANPPAQPLPPGRVDECNPAPRVAANVNPAFGATVLASVTVPNAPPSVHVSTATGNFAPVVVTLRPQPVTVRFDWESYGMQGGIADGGCFLEWTFPSSFEPQPDVKVEVSVQGSRTFTLVPPPPGTPTIDERRKYSIAFKCDGAEMVSRAQVDFWFAEPSTKTCPNPEDPFDPECPCEVPGDPRGCVPSCTGDDECPDGETCESGTCTPGGCGDDRDCPTGSICDGGSCTPSECGRDVECPIGSVCDGGRCTPGECSSDVECPFGSACDGGWCTPGECSGDLDCPGGFCNAGTCGGCISDAQCGAGTCQAGVCTGCASDLDCDGGSCRAGTCEPVNCPGGESYVCTSWPSFASVVACQCEVAE